jgi:hypothetical protein
VIDLFASQNLPPSPQPEAEQELIPTPEIPPPPASCVTPPPLVGQAGSLRAGCLPAPTAELATRSISLETPPWSGLSGGLSGCHAPIPGGILLPRRRVSLLAGVSQPIPPRNSSVAWNPAPPPIPVPPFRAASPRLRVKITLSSV